MVQFRSETMKHGTLVIPSDRAREFIDVLGRRANLQITDMNSSTTNRQYKKYIQRIDEMERILRFLMDEINKLPGATVERNQIDNFLQFDEVYQLDRVEESLQKLYQQFVKFRDNNADLQHQKNAAIEEKAVAVAATRFLAPDIGGVTSYRENAQVGLLDLESTETAESGRVGGDAATVGFSNLAGVIPQSDQEKFARTIFRTTRGNAFTHFETVEDRIMDMKTGKPETVLKNVFVVYYQGTRQSAVHERISRICQAFGVSVYEWPRGHGEAAKKIAQLDDLIVDKSRALEAYEEYFVGEIAVLLEVVRPQGNSLIEEWRLFCLKEKALYATLNLFEGSDVTLRADCWYPEVEEDDIRQLLLTQSNTQQVSAFLLCDGRPQPKSITPPTYFRCTEFTQGFQDFVDTYGVPRYKEANPALTTIITLPFLFGIMYGDIGHGACVLLLGIYMTTMWNSKLKYMDNEVLHMLGGGRFIILFMGIAATYAGFLYNDFFALGVDIFGTRYIDGTVEAGGSEVEMIRDPNKGVYPFGFDPAWKGATNEIDFFNSFKMKFSVIIAFVQMGTGVCHKALNALHSNDSLTFWFEFVPQLTFLVALVGYMDFMIVYKWVTPLSAPKPNIINTIINMFFFTVEDPFWSFQKQLQAIIVILMVICIPLMLFPKPLLMRQRHAKAGKSRRVLEMGSGHLAEEVGILKDLHVDHDDSDDIPTDSHGAAHTAIAVTSQHEEDEEEFDFAEEFIHQMIETIEFVLGTISNTASYLRLWALSLAHQQLALVFFENIMLMLLDMDINVILHGVLIFFAFAVFAAVTLGVMLCMDSLECFLHALRLQWVEFQNKFYKADGYKFVPFSFHKGLSAKEVD